MDKAFDWSIDLIVDWASQLTNPSGLVERCLNENASSGFRGVVRRFWVFPILCSIALDAVLVFSAFGFDLESRGPAFALYLVYTSLKWFIGAAAINLLLRLFRQTSNLNIVIACYTFIVIYAPIFSLLESLGLYQQIWIVSQLKAQQLDLMETIKFLVSHANELKQSELQIFATTLFFQMESTISLVASVFVAESLAWHLINDKFKTYLAVWLSSIVSLLPNAILNILWVLVEYRHTVTAPNIPN